MDLLENSFVSDRDIKRKNLASASGRSRRSLCRQSNWV